MSEEPRTHRGVGRDNDDKLKIGVVREVSFGMFDTTSTFETTYVSQYNGGSFTHHTNIHRPKFRIHSTEWNENQFEKEWMDLHESNLQGVLFEERRPQNLECRVVYFVVDKPPQFYETTRENDAPDHDAGRIIHSRIPCPRYRIWKSENPNECQLGVPWAIQYSRVIRVVYQRGYELGPETLKLRLSQRHMKTLFLLQIPRIEVFPLQVPGLSQKLNTNKKRLKNLFNSSDLLKSNIGCRIAVLKLFYNFGNSESLINDPVLGLRVTRQVLPPEPYTDRFYAKCLNKAAKDIDTTQVRSLRKFYDSLEGENRDNSTGPENYQGVLVNISSCFEHFFVENEDPPSQGIFELLVYPSHVEILGPIDLVVSNSITDQYHRRLYELLRVRFVDNPGKPFRAEAGADPDVIVQQRVVQVLNNEIQPLLPVLPTPQPRDTSVPQLPDNSPNNRINSFEFLGYSMSSLKKRIVWFCLSINGRGAKEIRDTIGIWDVDNDRNRKLAKQPSLWGARLSLAFTESLPVTQILRKDWDPRDDEGALDEYRNTDGCGVINQELCNAINDTLARNGLPVQQRQAFQIRFGGVKGVVYRGAKFLFDEYREREGKTVSMLLRKSQVKISVPGESNLMLRVVPPVSDGYSSLFFMAALKAFEDSGANTKKIMKIYEDTYTDLSTVTDRGLDYLEQIFKVPRSLPTRTNTRTQLILLKLALCLRNDGIFVESYRNSFLGLYLLKTAEKLRDKKPFDIPIPGSYSVLGLTDDCRVLRHTEPNQVFIRVGGKTITGPVLIYRDPITHIGDIQQAVALSEDEIRATSTYNDINSRIAALCAIDDVIFFSQFDTPPLPNKLAGGDLDGDRFEIASQPSGQTTNTFDVKNLTGFIGNYIRNDCFRELQSLLMCLADGSGDGLKDQKCKDLAPKLSEAVDYPKSGQAVNLAIDVLTNPNYVVYHRPTFLFPIDQRDARDDYPNYQRSEKLLGSVTRIEGVTLIHLRVEFVPPGQGSILQLRGEITEVWHSKTEVPPHLADDLEKVREFLRSLIPRKVHELGVYMVGPDIRPSTLVDLFMRKPHDDFPNKFIDILVGDILKQLESLQFIESTDRSCSPPIVRLRNSGPYSVEIIKRFYRRCLYEAWASVKEKKHRLNPEASLAEPLSERARRRLVKKTERLIKRRNCLNQHFLREAERKNIDVGNQLPRETLLQKLELLERREQSHLRKTTQRLAELERSYGCDPSSDRELDYNLVRRLLWRFKKNLDPLLDESVNQGSEQDNEDDKQNFLKLESDMDSGWSDISQNEDEELHQGTIVAKPPSHDKQKSCEKVDASPRNNTTEIYIKGVLLSTQTNGGKRKCEKDPSESTPSKKVRFALDEDTHCQHPHQKSKNLGLQDDSTSIKNRIIPGRSILKNGGIPSRARGPEQLAEARRRLDEIMEQCSKNLDSQVYHAIHPPIGLSGKRHVHSGNPYNMSGALLEGSGLSQVRESPSATGSAENMKPGTVDHELLGSSPVPMEIGRIRPACRTVSYPNVEGTNGSAERDAKEHRHLGSSQFRPIDKGIRADEGRNQRTPSSSARGPRSNPKLPSSSASSPIQMNGNSNSSPRNDALPPPNRVQPKYPRRLTPIPAPQPWVRLGLSSPFADDSPGTPFKRSRSGDSDTASTPRGEEKVTGLPMHQVDELRVLMNGRSGPDSSPLKRHSHSKSGEKKRVRKHKRPSEA
ncbi:hypothetical protein NUW58_g6374 [Xylaria curta]|uniref:Uncharacterized protein n=1 Tax=Xylaria curta TaxID=42375 RepID=A0ACC1NVE0_9PEZI|nr:hypothetical protein NUW58_g6374 [Xylaria curta]